tara:strand:+ start:6148 stop:7533 length:1386 start_codon:yes stop_codon:yes gene_type:complete
MALSNVPTNPHRNTPPMVLTKDNYTDPYLVVGQDGLPKEIYDQVVNHCKEMISDDALGFLDAFDMTKAFQTDYIEFLETSTRDQVLDDDGAVTRAGEVFTIDFTVVDGFEAGEDNWYFQPNDNIYVVDANGLLEQGVIETTDKAAGTFVAKCANQAAWSGLLVNLTLDTMGSDFDRGSCGPEGTLELRKTTSRFLKLNTVRKAMKSTGGTKYAWCMDGEWNWYDENKIKVRKRLNKEVTKKLLISIQSADASGAHAIGKYGTQGLFDNIETYGATQTGYIDDIAKLRALTEYWDSLGITKKEFIVHCNRTQYRNLEAIATLLLAAHNVQVNVDFKNDLNNYAKFGYNSLTIDEYTIHFRKWNLTDGNSPFGKRNTIDAMPKALFIPMGTTETKVNGVEQSTPYIFKAYQQFPEHNQMNMIREVTTGAFAPTPTNTCEYEMITLTTTVGLVVVCPELFVIVK